MSTLDEKLGAIYQRCDVSNNGTDDPLSEAEAITEIKQAFKDAGYSKSPLADIRAQMEISGMLSGNAWYDRFERELKGWIGGAYSGNVDEVLSAAKKAGGLS